MNNNFIFVGVTVVLVFLLLALGDFLPFWMPDMDEMLVLLAVTLLVTFWTGFIFYERAYDEREIVHRLHAGRIAYASGVAVLTIGLCFQGLADAIDPWLLLALGTMVVTKMIVRLFFDTYR